MAKVKIAHKGMCEETIMPPFRQWKELMEPIEKLAEEEQEEVRKVIKEVSEEEWERMMKEEREMVKQIASPQELERVKYMMEWMEAMRKKSKDPFEEIKISPELKEKLKEMEIGD